MAIDHKRIKRIMAVVDPTAYTQHAVTRAVAIARSCGAALELFICDFDPALSGRRFTDSDTLASKRREFVVDRSDYLEDLADELRESGINVECHVRWDNPVYRGILARIAEAQPDLVVKDTHHHSLLHRTLLTNTDWHLIRACPVPLMLVKSSDWPTRPVIMAAIDPDHQGDQQAALDRQILDYGAFFARQTGGTLHAAHAFFPAALLALTAGMARMPTAGGMTPEEVVARERARVETLLAAATAPYALPPEQVHLMRGSAEIVLPQAAAFLRASLLVMGAVSRSALDERFIGSVAERVLDRIPCDVLVVKAPDFETQPSS